MMNIIIALINAPLIALDRLANFRNKIFAIWVEPWSRLTAPLVPVSEAPEVVQRRADISEYNRVHANEHQEWKLNFVTGKWSPRY